LSAALPALVQAQSLADVARKERERRDKLRKAGTPTRVITEEELKAAPGRLASLPTEGEPSTASGSRPADEPPNEGTPPPPNPSRRLLNEEQHWRSLVGRARARLRDAEARYRQLDRAIRIGQPEMYDANGLRVIYSQQQMKVMADAAQIHIEAARKDLDDLLDQARRAGALPGWLREP
jgi:hypothetical protein